MKFHSTGFRQSGAHYRNFYFVHPPPLPHPPKNELTKARRFMRHSDTQEKKEKAREIRND